MEIITRAEARERGITKYFTGVICRNGHFAARYVSDCKCVVCKSESSKNRKIYFSKYYEENKNAYIARASRYVKKKAERQKVYVAENRERNRPKAAERMARYRRSSPERLLASRIRARLGVALRSKGFGKSSRTAEILGCSWVEFAAHIERQFLPGMSWANRSEWHIDHIIPLASAVTESEVLALNHLTNLRPIWAKDNFAKRAKQTHLI